MSTPGAPPPAPAGAGGAAAATMDTLAAGHLLLEPLRAEHAESMYALLDDAQVLRYVDEVLPASVAALRERYARLESRCSPDGTQVWLNWAVGLPGQAPLGYVQATVLPPHRAWIGYVLGSAHWGHGHGFAAVGAMLEHLRSRYGVTRFQASVEAANVRSIRLLERLGFLEATPQEAATLGMSRSERLYQRTLS